MTSKSSCARPRASARPPRAPAAARAASRSPARRWLAGGARLVPVARGRGGRRWPSSSARWSCSAIAAASRPRPRRRPRGRQRVRRARPQDAAGRSCERELALIGAATSKVHALARLPRVQPPTAPLRSTARPAPALLSTLGVLRRPATAADRSAAEGRLGDGSRRTAVYAGAARRVATAAANAYYIVPIRQDPAAAFPSARCFACSWPHCAGLSRRSRRRCGRRRWRSQARSSPTTASLAATPPGDGVCVVDRRPANGSGTACGTTAAGDPARG